MIGLEEEAVNAARYVDGVVRSGGYDGRYRSGLLGYFPVARTNPFQQLLYRNFLGLGLAPLPLFSLDEVEKLGDIRALVGRPVILHLHWTAPVLKDTGSRKEAERACAEFLAMVDRLKEMGVGLVWTVHNILPHDCSYPEVESRLRGGLVERADIVHVMTTGTRKAVEGLYEIEIEKMAYVPHPSYEGVYANSMARDQARYEIGLDHDELVVGFVGSIQPYKGVGRLLSAYRIARSESENLGLRLVICGEAQNSNSMEGVMDECYSDPGIVLDVRKIPDRDMQIYLNGVDAVVLPYERILNSGVAMLAVSFGTPVIVPDVASMRETVGEDAGIFFVPGNSRSLANALRNSIYLKSGRRQVAAREVARRHKPSELSSRLYEEIRASGLLKPLQRSLGEGGAGEEGGGMRPRWVPGGLGKRAAKRSKPVIGLVGYFGWGNFGDELFVTVLQEWLGEQFELKVMHDLLKRPYFSDSAAEAVEGVDAIVIGGGDLIIPWSVSGLYWRREYLKKPVFIAGVGVPTWGGEDSVVIQRLGDFIKHPSVKFFWARDEESLNWVHSRVGPVKNSFCAPDMVCGLELPAAEEDPQLLGVAVRQRKEDEDYTHLVEMCERARELGYRVRQVVLGTGEVGERDVEASRKVGLSGGEFVQSESLQQLVKAVGECTVFASMKFHGSVVASMYGRETIALSGTDKNRNFMKLIGKPEAVCPVTSKHLPDRVPESPVGLDEKVRKRIRSDAAEALDALRSAIEGTLAK